MSKVQACPISPAQGSDGDATPMTAAPEDQGPQDQEKVTPLRKPMRRRNTAHLAFVAAQPCLVCQRSPCDAHHLKFAQPRSLGRKVSDEFTVPLCRDHHRELHRQGNESGWWANVQIAPLGWRRSCGKPRCCKFIARTASPTSLPTQKLGRQNERHHFGAGRAPILCRPVWIATRRRPAGF
jgi:hypothetical protein